MSRSETSRAHPDRAARREPWHAKSIPLALVAALVFLGHHASADERRNDAAGCYASARTAYKSGDYRGAAVLFACAYQYAGKPELKYNEGLAWHLAGEAARAADAFAFFLAQSKLDIPDKKEDARLRLELLASQLFTLTLRSASAAARASVDGATEVVLPSTLHLLPGRYRVDARAAGFTPRAESVVAVAGGVATLDLDLTAEVPREVPTPRPVRESPPGGRGLTVAWAGLAFAGAAGVASVVLGLEVEKTLGDFEAGGRRDRSLRDTAVTLRTATNVAWIAAAGVGAASATLLVVRLRRSSSASSARVRATGAGASLSFSFSF